MAKKIKNPKTNKVIRLEFSPDEFAEKILNVTTDDLLSWKKSIPPFSGRGKNVVYAITSAAELDLWKKRAALLKTRMTETAVRNVEKNNLLDAYAKLAADCPDGITAHAWRSYGLIVLMQMKYSKQVGPAELAKRADINRRDEKGKVVPDEKMAAKHIRLLEALGYIKDVDGRWEHQGLPEAWQGNK